MTQNRMVRREEVSKMVGLAASTLRAKVSTGEFPRPAKIGKRAIAWPLHTVEAWMEERVRASEQEAACEK